MNKRINRYSAEDSLVLPNGLFLLASAAVIVALFWDNATGALVSWAPTADYWAHVAVLREWLQSGTALANPYVNGPALSSHFVPHFWALSVIGKALGMDALQLMVIGAVVNFVLIAIGLRLFLSYYFRHAWAPFLGLLVLFTFWGIAGDAVGSGPGLFQLRNFLQVAADPSSFAFGLSLISFWATMRLLRSDATMPLWALVLAALQALIFISHPLTGLFCASGCVLLVYTEFSTSLITQLAAVVAVLAGLALAEFWPFFSVWKLTLGLYGVEMADWSSAGLLGAPLESFAAQAWSVGLYDPSVVFAVLGLSLLGVPVILRLMQRGEQPFIIYGALLMLLPYALNVVFTIPLAHRFLLFAVFYLQLAVVWGWLRLISAWSEIPRPPLGAPMLLISLVVGILAILLNVWLVFQEKEGRAFSSQTLKLIDSRTSLPDGMNVEDLYRELLIPVAEDGVVLATPVPSWPIPAFKAHVVSLLNDNPVLPDHAERAAATNAFFYQPTDDLQRIATIQRYNVSNVLLNLDDMGLHADVTPWLNSYSRLVASRGAYRMYELAEALHRVELPKPPPNKTTNESTNESTNETPAQDSADDAGVVTRRPARTTGNGARSPEAPVSGRPAVGEPAGGEPESDAPPSFGAPIAPPVLNPQRNGG